MSTKTYDPITIRVVNELFKELVSINPAFKQAWPTEQEFINTKRQWMMAFEEAGISSIEQVKKGLKAVRLSSRPFIPSPGWFIDKCRATHEDIGAPTVRAAYNEAMRKSVLAYGVVDDWSHPVVKSARNAVGTHNLSNRTEKETFPRFEEAYSNACNDFASGRNLNQIEQAKRHSFTDVEMNWILNYKKCIDEGIDPEKSGLFPSEAICKHAEELHSKWSGGNGVKK